MRIGGGRMWCEQHGVSNACCCDKLSYSVRWMCEDVVCRGLWCVWGGGKVG